MKRFLTIMLALLLIAAYTAPALAWEFEMKGEYEYRLRYFSRTGDRDLFGLGTVQFPLADGTFSVGFAGPNIYGSPYSDTAIPGPIVVPGDQATTAKTGPAAAAPFSERIVRGGFSQFGSDAIYNDSRLTFVPTIKVNPAIRVHGVYTVGGLRHKYMQFNSIHDTAAGNTEGIGVPPFERYYVHQTSMNAYDTAAIGSWEQFRATIQLPIGIWSIGVKDFPFGLGSTLGYNTRSEAFLTVVPWGPFRFLHGIWLARSVNGRGDFFTNALRTLGEGWATIPEGDSKPTIFQGMLFTYDNGPLSAGAGTIYRQYHANAFYAASQTAATFAAATTQPTVLGSDQNLLFWLAYAKYNNGRFFLNAEYAFFTIDTYRIGGAQTFNEGYHAFGEMGALAGPARLTLMAAIASGPVLGQQNPTKVYTPFPINYQAMEPYELLMFNTYAGGNQAFGGVLTVSDGHGMMSDAYAFAARGDYALASNLNIWASYIWAHRLEQSGTAFGGINSRGFAATAAEQAIFAAGAGRGAAPVTIAGGGNAHPAFGYVSDGFVGWEANAGVDWKLLEGLTMTWRYSYWQPGQWFDQAYQAVNASAAGIGPYSVLESKSAINAITGSLMINF